MLTRWNDLGLGDLDRGFSALNDLRQEMDRLFQRFESEWPGDFPLWTDNLWNGGALDTSWPHVQVRDEGDELHVIAEVPGFMPDDLQVSLEQGSLTLRGERHDEVPEGYSVHRKERGAIRFARSFTLPARVEADKVEARLSNGVLELTLPKVAEERPRAITVRAA
jgi:HSP20 family protein